MNGTLNYTFSCLANQTASAPCTASSCNQGSCCMARSVAIWGANQTLQTVCAAPSSEGSSSQAYALGANFTTTLGFYQQCLSEAASLAVAGALALSLLAML